jgi:hypothetical protein
MPSQQQPERRAQDEVNAREAGRPRGGPASSIQKEAVDGGCLPPSSVPAFGAYWLKGTFSQLRTSPPVLLPATVNRT